MPRRRTRHRSLAVIACALLPGCVFLPAQVDTYDRDCRFVSHHLVLQAVQLAAIDHCVNQSCLVLVVAAAATAAASAIVSGSVVLVGNAAYWVEKQSVCATH